MSLIPNLSLIYLTFLSLQHITQSQTDEPKDDDDDEAFSDIYIFGMVGVGFTSAILITIMLIHSVWHFSHDKVKVTGWAKFRYILVFVLSILTALFYALLRSDLILPVGDTIPCVIGYAGGITSLGLSRLALYSVYMGRISQTFAGSALAYSHKLLYSIQIAYVIGAGILVACQVYFGALELEYVKADNSVVGLCAVFNPSRNGLITGIAFVLGDLFFTIWAVILFVRKLRELVNLTATRGPKRAASVEPTASSQDKTEQLHDSTTSPKASKNSSKKKSKHVKSPSRNSMDQNTKLERIMRKQTSLLVFMSITSIVIFVAGGLIPPISLQLPIDQLINCACVWLMFRFADKFWNCLVRCFCCCCEKSKDAYLARMHTLSRNNTLSRLSTRLSLHSSPKGIKPNPASPGSADGTTEMQKTHSGHDPIPAQLTDRGKLSLPNDFAINVGNESTGNESLEPSTDTDVSRDKVPPMTTFAKNYKARTVSQESYDSDDHPVLETVPDGHFSE